MTRLRPLRRLPVTAVGWDQLLDHPGVVEGARHGSPVGVMAFHGGLEAGTLEIAEEVAARTGASHYFVSQPADLRWHVKSHAVDPARSPLLAAWLDHVEVAVAIHGYGRVHRPRRVLLGGRNRPLAAAMAAALDVASGFEAVHRLEEIPPELRGLHPANPVNRPAHGGVQVELPPSARDPELAAALSLAPACVVDALVAAIDGWTAQAA